MWTPQYGSIASWIQFSGSPQVVLNSTALPLSLSHSFVDTLSVPIKKKCVIASNFYPSFTDLSKRIYSDTFAIPVYVALLSIATLSLHLLARSESIRKLFSRSSPKQISTEEEDSIERPYRGHIHDLGGPLIFAYKIARLLLCFILLALNVFYVVTSARSNDGIKSFSDADWLRIGLIGVYVRSPITCTFPTHAKSHPQLKTYASTLAAVSVSTKLATSKLVTRHLVLLLTATVFVYTYRDLWPMATYTLDPIDAALSPFIWIEVTILGIAGIFVPLCIPRQYIPLDPTVNSLPPIILRASMLIPFHADLSKSTEYPTPNKHVP